MPGLDEWDVSSKQLANAHGYAARTDYHKDNAKAQATMQLAREILRLARSTLLIHLRFMEPALVRLAANGDESITAELATDGRYLYYNSIHVCRLFKRARELPARDYLHVTLHCVFRHLFVGRKLIGDLWDLACDIAVENLINELDIKSLYCERQEKQRWLIEKLREAMPRLTAERIYHWLIEQDLPPQEVGRIRGYFYADDHRVWHNPPEMASGTGGDTQDKGSGGEKPDMSRDDLAAVAEAVAALSPEDQSLLAAVQASPYRLTTAEQFREFPDNIDFFVLEPQVKQMEDLGWRYLEQHLDLELSPALKAAIDPVPFGRQAMEEDRGCFTKYGYLSLSGDEWQHEQAVEHGRRETEKKPSIRERLEQSKKECAGKDRAQPIRDKSAPEL